ncbi:MAG: hypothetical protein U1E42_00035 [Rhodospirillales bacterium]
MSIIEGVIRLIAFCAIIIVVTLILLLVSRYGFRLHVSDAPYFLVHIVNEANATLSKSPFPNLVQSLSTLTWLEGDVRQELVELFKVHITMVDEPELDVAECGRNLIALLSFTAFSTLLPFVLIVSHGLLVFSPRYGGDYRWVMLLLSVPLGVLFGAIALLGVVVLWFLVFFNDMTLGYFVGWLFGGPLAIRWGAALGLYLLFAPIEYCVPKHVIGSLSNTGLLNAFSPRAIFGKIFRTVTWVYYSCTSRPISGAKVLPSVKRSEFMAQRNQAYGVCVDAQREVFRKEEALEQAKRDLGKAAQGELDAIQWQKVVAEAKAALAEAQKRQAEAEQALASTQQPERKQEPGSDLSEVEREVELLITHTSSVTEAIDRLMRCGEELKRKHEARSDISEEQKENLLELIDNQIEQGVRRLRAVKAKGAGGGSLS